MASGTPSPQPPGTKVGSSNGHRQDHSSGTEASSGFIERWARCRPLLIVILMASYSAQSLLITASKRRGDFEYDATAAVLLAELLKLVFSALMMPPEVRATIDPRNSLPYTLPALLYTAQNVLVFEALRHLSPPHYQLLNNAKLFTTSIVYRIAMQRQLRVVQWLALILLGLGMCLVTVEDTPCPSPDTDAASSNARSMAGSLTMCAVAWCSAFAGVSNEWLIKRSRHVLEANFWLYTYGVLVAAVHLAYTGGFLRLLRLEGFSMSTWLVVLCNAVLGQSIAYLFRYADSIVKVYAVCAAMGFTTLASVVFFGFSPNFQMLAGYVACALSVCLYYVPAEVLIATDSSVLQGLRQNGKATDTNSNADGAKGKTE